MKRRSVARLVAVLAAAGLAAGCSGGGSDDDAGGVADEAPASQAQEAAPAEKSDAGTDDAGGSEAEGETDKSSGSVIAEAVSAVDGRDIIYTVDLNVEVENVNRAAREAATIAIANGGFVAQEETTSDEHYATLTLKIPVDVQSEAVNQIEDLGEVTHRGRSTRDVTQEVVDVESRIASQRASISRIRALLDEATDLEQVIDIEAELASREADLDSLLSRQEELSALTSMATVTVTFHRPDKEPEVTEEPNEQGFVVGLRNGWDGFTAFVSVVLTAVGAVLPFAALAAVIGLPVLYIRRGRKNAVTTPATEPPPPPVN